MVRELYWLNRRFSIFAFLFEFLPINLILSIILCLFSTLAFSFIFNVAFSNSAYAEARQSTIVLSTNANNLSVDLRPSPTGAFDKSEDINIGVRTDNFTGYTLSIKSASSGTNSTSLTDGNNHYIESISSSLSESDFKNSSNTQYNNKWGYKPSQYITTSNNVNTTIENTNYLPAPGASGNILDITNAANNENKTYIISLGARIDGTLPAGSYTNNFIIYAVANNTVFNIDYDKNTTDTVTSMPTPNPAVVTIEGGTSAAESNTTLSNATPQRTGYNFTGWCDTATTLDTNTGNQVCSTTAYQPSSTYGIDQTAGSNIRLYAIWELKTYNITLSTSSGISSINVTKDGNNVCSVSGPTPTTCQLKYNMTYNIEATPNTGFSFNEWQNSTLNGTIGNTSQASTTFTPGLGATTLTATATANTYSITLNKNGATNTPTASTTATYGSTTLGAIATLPEKSNTTGTRTISGFTKDSTSASDATVTYNSTQASGSTCSAADNCKSTNSTSYTFNGWHESSGTGTLVASKASTPALQASVSGYTNSSSQWTKTSGATLYAGWDSSAGAYSSVTLPTITKTGYTCHWNTNSSDTGTTYASGASITPSGNITLTGFCSVNTYSLTITFAGSGVDSVQVRTATGTGGTLKGTVSSSGGSVSGLTYNTAYYLYPVFTSGYGLNNWAKTSSTGALSSTTDSNPTFTMGAGNGAVTITGINTIATDYCAANNVSDENCMQKMTTCPTTATLITDARDGTEYTVQQLADGNCWTLDNLAIDPASLSWLQLYGSNNQHFTNASATTLTYLKNGGGSGQYASSAVSSSWGASLNAPKIKTSYKNTVNGVGGDGQNEYGIYYNYCAASAGSYCYSGDGSTGNATEDLCPAGWRMPIGEETTALYTAYSSNSSNTARALSLPYSGSLSSGGSLNSGKSSSSTVYYSYWWSPIRLNNTTMYTMGNGASSSYIYFVPQSSTNIGGRNGGLPMRCIKKDPIPDDKPTTYIQDVDDTYINNMTTGQSYMVKDRRDERNYKIAKLADGNVWMLDNLAVDPSSLTQAQLYGTGTNAGKMTNASNATLGYLKNGGGSGQYASSAVSSSWSASLNAPKIKTSYKNTVDGVGGDGQNEYGIYYNYCAASAGSYCYSGDGSTGNATEDLCPAGWRMPIGEETTALYTAYSSNSSNTARALSLPYSGSLSSGGSLNSGKSSSSTVYYSYWWSPIRRNNTRMYVMGNGASSSYIYFVPQNSANGGRNGGLPMRCIKKDPIPDDKPTTYIQDVDDTYINNMTTGQSYMVKDRRDERNYKIAKLADGNVWMLDNLAVDPSSLTQAQLYGTGTNAGKMTNASNATLGYLKNGGGSGQYASAAVANVSSWNESNTAPKIYASYKNNNANSFGSSGQNEYGIYYNFCAASAGSYCYSDESTGNATEDLCPAGWRMPTSGDTGEYQALYTVYSNNDNNTATALSLTYSGFINGSNSSPSEASSGSSNYSYWWSSTRYNNSLSYLLRNRNNSSASFYPSYVYNGNSYTRKYGFTMRCIKKDS